MTHLLCNAAPWAACQKSHFASDQRGVSAMTFGILAPLLVGVSGLGIDVTNWQLTKHNLQTTADVAAIAGAMTLANGGDQADINAAVIQELQRNGFVADGDRANIKIDVVSAAERSADGSAKTNVELSLTQLANTYFSGFFLPSAPLITTAATAGVLEGGSGDICILGLHEWMPDTVAFQGTVDADLNCAVASNSESAASISAGGNAAVQTSSMQAYGGFGFGSNTNIMADTLFPYGARIIDPYGPDGRNLAPPPSSTCDHRGNLMLKGRQTLQPGRFCGDIRLNNADVTFSPGIYIIDGGDLRTNGNSSMYGDGVTFVFTANTSSNVGGLDIAGGTHMELTAPNESDLTAWSLGYHGVLFFQDPIAESLQGGNIQTNKLLGGSSAVLRGAIYFPQQALVYSGGAALASGCLQLIGLQVSLQGNAAMTLDEETCALTGAEPIQAVKVSVFS